MHSEVLWSGPNNTTRIPRWDSLYALFTEIPGARQIIVMDIDRLQTSCGFGVPLYDLKEQRDVLVQWADKKGQEGVHEYQQKNNLTSIDGLPTPLNNLSQLKK